MGILSLTALAASSQAVVYDAHDDFSTTVNTSTSMWQYAYLDSSGYHLFSEYSNGGWRTPNVDVYLGAYNASSPYLVQHPGPSPTDQVSVVRFTASTTGLYNVTSAFANANNATTNFDLLHNGVSLFPGTINGGNAAQTYTSQIFLVAGDTLDNIVGNGGNNYYYDSTFSQLTVSSVPGPASFVSFGLMGLSALRRRARK